MTAWLAAQLARKAAPFVVLALAVCCALLLAGTVTLAILLAYARAELAQTVSEHERQMRKQADDAVRQSELMRADYEERVKFAQATADQLAKDLEDARANESKLAADLRSGAVRVRRALCAPSVPKSSASPSVDGRGGPDAAGSASALVGAVDRLHAKYEACRAIAKGDRGR